MVYTIVVKNRLVSWDEDAGQWRMDLIGRLGGEGDGVLILGELMGDSDMMEKRMHVLRAMLNE